jgi:hypothetical protein
MTRVLLEYTELVAIRAALEDHPTKSTSAISALQKIKTAERAAMMSGKELK